MIKKLRQKFVLVAMLSVLLVLTVIIGTINVVNYLKIDSETNVILNILTKNNGTFPQFGNMGAPSPEAPFETRYFTVTVSESGSVLFTDMNNIAAVSESSAASVARTLFEKGKSTGFYGDYKYATAASTQGTMYIFLDCSRNLSNFRTFLTVSLLISLGGLVLVFILVLVLSKIVLRPVAESYTKQKQFITNASHDIKTPLTVIDADAEVLEMEYGETEWSKDIKEQVKRLTSMTEKLVFLSRMQEDSPAMNMAVFFLSDALEEAAQPYGHVAAAQGKSFSTEITPSVCICGDEGMVCRLMALLLDNALKYADDGGNITLSLRRVGKNCEIRVRNTVEAVDQGDLHCFFDRFYRADSSRNSQTGGHGIGLSVAKAITEAHKGKIEAYSDDGKSVTVTVSLRAT